MKAFSTLEEFQQELKVGQPFTAEILPDVAQAILTKANLRNRERTSPTEIRKLVRALQTGRWNTNVMMFYSDLNLADGQNRLMAIVKAQVPGVCWVLPNVDSVSHLDDGFRRSVADNLDILAVPNASIVASAAQALFRLRNNNRSGSNQEVIELFHADEPFLTETGTVVSKWVEKPAKINLVLDPATLAAARVLGIARAGYAPAAVDNFLENVVCAGDLDPSQPFASRLYQDLHGKTFRDMPSRRRLIKAMNFMVKTLTGKKNATFKMPSAGESKKKAASSRLSLQG